MTDEEIYNLGPLAALVGTWQGEKGDDHAPDDDRSKVETNKFHERMVFEPTGRVANHEQTLHGLRYRTTAWRIGEDRPFHEELGYWMWDAREKQVMRCLVIPRGVTVIAGGTVNPDARIFELVAELGSPTYGICSNPFLDREFRTVRFEIKLNVQDNARLVYEQDTQLAINGQHEICHHRDANTLRRVDS